MPTLLTRCALQLVEAGVDSYILALCGAALPDLRRRRLRTSRYAPLAGLLGAGFELLAKACVVQAKGESALYRDNGAYEYADTTLRQLRQGINDSDADFAFLWQGKDEEIRRDELLSHVERGKLLLRQRAAGLHAGKGPHSDVIMQMLQDIYAFVETLGRSRRLQPYLRAAPKPPEPAVKRAALIEDLAQKVKHASSVSSAGEALASLYIVLPYVPEIQPRWLEAFERLTVTPCEDDLQYLLSTLEKAHGITLFRQRAGGEATPVQVRDEPGATVIAPQFLKRAFTDMKSQFYADVAQANGRLDKGLVDLPPDEVVLDLYVVGLSNIISEGTDFTSQQVWPFVVSALNAQGTPRPYWFLVRACDDWDHLQSFLRRVLKIGGTPYFDRRAHEVLSGIQRLTEGQNWSENGPVRNEIYQLKEQARRQQASLAEALERHAGTEREPPPDIESAIVQCIEEESVGQPLELLVDDDSMNPTGRKYWARVLAEASHDQADRAGLLKVLRTDELSSAATACRKAFRLLDFTTFGPERAV